MGRCPWWARSGRTGGRGGRPRRPGTPALHRGRISARRAYRAPGLLAGSHGSGSAPGSGFSHPPRARTRRRPAVGPGSCAGTDPEHGWPWPRSPGPREDPGVVPPRLDGILGQPAAQRRGRDRLDQPAADDLSPQLLKAPPADRNATGHRQFTGDRLDLGHDGRREHPRPAGPLAIPESVHPLSGVALAPLGGGVGCDPEGAGDPCISPPAGGQQHDPGPGDLPLLRGWLADQRLEPPTLPSPKRDLKRAAPATACHGTAPPLLLPAAPDRTATRQDTATTKRAGSAKMTHASDHPRIDQDLAGPAAA